MPFKLTKVLSSIVTLMLVLLQVDQSMALREDLRRDKKETLTLLDNSTDFQEPVSMSLSNQDETQESNWEQILTTQSPGTRAYHGMAYDNNQDVIVLFGGDPTAKGMVRLDDTWEYDGSNWDEVSPELSPQARTNINQAMIYDQARDRIVLFGGLTYTGRKNDTWEYYQDGAIRVWEPITPTVKPIVRDTHAMVYDPTRQVTVMFGGWSPDEPGNFLQDTWEYDGNDWNNIATDFSPSARQQHALAYDSQRGVVVLFGGRYAEELALTSALNDTWEYDGSDWHQVTTANAPSPRSHHGMAYDPKRKVIVLYGGHDGKGDPVEDDTWEYDGTNWVQVNTTVSPIDRFGTPLVYDNQRGKMVVFGGGIKNGLKTSDETWEYSVWENNQRIYLPIITK